MDASCHKTERESKERYQVQVREKGIRKRRCVSYARGVRPAMQRTMQPGVGADFVDVRTVLDVDHETPGQEVKRCGTQPHLRIVTIGECWWCPKRDTAFKCIIFRAERGCTRKKIGEEHTERPDFSWWRLVRLPTENLG
jgi:hypothetical protein